METLHETTNTPPEITALEGIISEMSGVRVQDIKSRVRMKRFADARHAVWYVANKHMKYSLKQISRIYQRDHTTVLSGVRKMHENKFGENVTQFIKDKHPDLLKGKNITRKKVPENWTI